MWKLYHDPYNGKGRLSKGGGKSWLGYKLLSPQKAPPGARLAIVVVLLFLPKKPSCDLFESHLNILLTPGVMCQADRCQADIC